MKCQREGKGTKTSQEYKTTPHEARDCLYEAAMTINRPKSETPHTLIRRDFLGINNLFRFNRHLVP